MKKSTDPQVAEYFSACYVPYRFTVVVTRLHALSITLLSQMNPIYTVLLYSFKVHFSKFSSTPRSTQFLFPFFFAVILGCYLWIIDDNPVFPFLQIGVNNASDSATCLTTWPVMEMPNRSFLYLYIYIYIYVYWCTGRLPLIEMYDNGDLNQVQKKIIKKNMRRIPKREFVFIKCWYFYICCYKKIIKTVGSTGIDTWW